MDEKKSTDHFERAIEGIIILLLISSLLQSISFDFLTTWSQHIFQSLISSASIVVAIFTVMTIIALFLFMYFFIKLREVRNDEYHLYRSRKITQKDPERRLEWDTVMTHSKSGNPAEWKIAILEADRILSRILLEHGFTGDTIAEQLKAIPKGTYKHLDNIWDAHKVRNKIAHEGVAYNLSKREFMRVINLYERFFKETGDL